jgi:uracil phosphoribosyltransferase
MSTAGFTVLDHPLAGDLLTRLRDRETGPAEYRALTRRLGLLLVAEATRDLATEAHLVDTPLEPFEGTRVAKRVVAIPVLRAGLGLLEAVTDLYPDAVVGYLGMERDEETLEPRDYYAKLPPMDGRRALILDPMLATGGSGAAAVTHVKAHASPKSISFVCIVAAPEGIARMASEHPDVPIVTATLDRQLNDVGFIVPGLGDFGDRLHGTEA